jgi:DnaJ-class molecular chaperone
MVRKLNHYKVLGVAPNASEEDVKKAYRSLVRTAHPDKGGSAERFQRIQKSYESILQKITTTSAIIQKANETENSKEKKNREGRRTREGNGDSCGDVKQRREKGRATFEKSEKEGRKIDESETNTMRRSSDE